MPNSSNFTDVHFDPDVFDSVLNSHSASSDDDCNIDSNWSFDCKYFDSHTINSIDLTNGHLSLFHHNARSLNKNGNTITDYISTLNHHFDIYGFTETWFNSDDDANLVDIEGYSYINCIRKGRTGGGASLFIHPKYNYIDRRDLEINTADCDSVFVEIPQKHHNIIIGNVYKPDTVNIKDFITQLDMILNTINKEKKTRLPYGRF